LIEGWPRIAYVSDLEVDLSTLPSGCEVSLRVLSRLADGAKLERMAKRGTSGYHTLFDVRPRGRAALRGMSLKTSDKSQALLTLTVPQGAASGAYQLSVRQLVGGKEMGRIIKRVIIGDHPYMANAKTREIHVVNCDWAQKIGPSHRVAYRDVESALRSGYNGCCFCLPEYDQG
jgi:hypothetical protein